VKNEKDTPKDTGLRRRAEERLKGEKKEAAPPPAEEDALRMVHELEVHQIELEIQNEELRKSQEQLEESRSEYAELYDFAPVGYLTFDNMGLVTRANLTACGLLGLERSLLVKKPFSLFIHPKSQDLFYFHKQKVLETTTIQTCQLVLKRKDGTLFDAELESIAVQVKEEPAFNTILTDITERRQAEETLRRYELLSQNSRDIVLLVRRDDGSILEANTAAVNVYGYGRDELLKLAIRGLRADGTEGLTAAQMAQADSGGILFETIHRRKDGTTLPVEVSSQGATIDGTRMLISVIRDITERKRAEEALQRSERRYHSLFENMLDGFAYCKMLFDDRMRPVDFVYLEVNDAFGRLTGLKNVTGKKVTEVIPGIREAHPELFEIYGRVALTGRPERFEIHFAPLEIWLDISVYSTEREHFVAVFDDISERKKAEEVSHQASTRLTEEKNEVDRIVAERTLELTRAYESLRVETEERQRAEAELRQAQKIEALGIMSGGIAHDFNNILAAIVGFTELMTGRVPKGSREDHYLARVMEAAIRGRELVRQMLAFSRQSEQEKKPLRLSGVVKETVRLMRATTPATIAIRVKTLSESGPVLGDPTQMQQVLMNLCTNATHAMREKGGFLDIELSDFTVLESNDNSPHGITPGLYMKLTVRDTGDGIPPGIMEKIFDPFFTTKKPGEGTGLGLSVVHGIVKQSNGYITVESGQDRGTAFTVYLPVISRKLKTGGISDEEIPTGSERILFVDDEEALAEMGKELLAELGYEVTSRMNCREALALFRLDPSRFDLVITDQTMPGMTGVDLAKEVLAIRADMPIIMCTGFSELVDARKAEAIGIRAFAMKPLTKREIAITIRKVLDK